MLTMLKQTEEGDSRGAGRAITINDITLTPQRYAELMWLIDSWFVEGHDWQRRDTIARGQRVFRGT